MSASCPSKMSDKFQRASKISAAVVLLGRVGIHKTYVWVEAIVELSGQITVNTLFEQKFFSMSIATGDT